MAAKSIQVFATSSSGDPISAILLTSGKSSKALRAEVRQLFTIPNEANMYFTLAGEADVVPLSPFLLPNTALALHCELPAPTLQQAPPPLPPSLEASEALALEEDELQTLGIPRKRLLQGSARYEGIAITEDFANERTFLAWARTAAATTRTAFSFTTMKVFRRVTLHWDLGVTVTVGMASICCILLGWQRFISVREGAGLNALFERRRGRLLLEMREVDSAASLDAIKRKRCRILPYMVLMLVVAGICVFGALATSPRRFEKRPAFFVLTPLEIEL